MTLRLIREPSVRETTHGVLFVDGHFQCFTLEDCIREVPDRPVALWKIPGRTAIPAGSYQVRLSYSSRFQRVLPIVLDVPGFTGIRIHAGNVIADTEGCILVGRTRKQGCIGESRLALEALLPLLVAAPTIDLRVENPDATP